MPPEGSGPHSNAMTSTPILPRIIGRSLRRSAVAVSLLVAATGAGIAGPTPAGAIIGGTTTNGSVHPYFVRLTVAGRLCGASVIDRTRVLTAAHCVDEGVTVNQVRLHISDTTSASATGLVIHPLWNGHVADGHDLALVSVAEAATAGVKPLQVGDPRDDDIYAPGRHALTVGRGRTTPNGTVSSTLQQLETTLRSDSYMDDVYNKAYWFDQWNADLMIGAGTTTRTVCKGDSGGPLVTTRNGTPIQVGVTSFTEVTGTPCDQAGGFAELRGAQLAWIGAMVDNVERSWGSCTTRHGRPGRMAAIYDSTSAWAPYREDRFYWGFECRTMQAAPPKQRPGGGTTPPPEDDGPPPCYPHCSSDY